jgi:transcriptional regulator with XRE-family HTH domain
MAGKGSPLTAEEIAKFKIKPKDIAKIVTSRRAGKRLTQYDVAKQMGVSHSTVMRMERGEIDATTIRFLNWLLDGEDSINEMWRKRALVAESCIKDIIGSTREYREAQQLMNGERMSNGGQTNL